LSSRAALVAAVAAVFWQAAVVAALVDSVQERGLALPQAPITRSRLAVAALVALRQAPQLQTEQTAAIPYSAPLRLPEAVVVVAAQPAVAALITTAKTVALAAVRDMGQHLLI
jgi:hypothetical protein